MRMVPLESVRRIALVQRKRWVGKALERKRVLHEFLGTNTMSPKTRICTKDRSSEHVRTDTSLSERSSING